MRSRIIQSIFSINVVTLLLLFSNLAVAAEEGQLCIDEPTDESIAYGDVRTCSISPTGDSDLFRFIGSVGDLISVRADDQAGASFPNQGACVELFEPDGTKIGPTICHDVIAEIQTTLVQSGEYTVRVTESGDNQGMSYALMLERFVPASPSATPITSGVAISGEMISPHGDMDLFIFQGVTGNIISLKVTDQAGGSFPNQGACIQLFKPDGTSTTTACHDISAIIDITLDQDGEYMILVTEAGNNQAMNYNLEYQCLFGICPPIQRPQCDIQMAQTNYVDGETVTVDVLRLANFMPYPIVVELKMWLGLPEDTMLGFPEETISVVNAGADWSLIFPTGTDVDLGPVSLFVVDPSDSRGSYEFSCRMLDPDTGRLLVEDRNFFDVQ